MLSALDELRASRPASHPTREGRANAYRIIRQAPQRRGAADSSKNRGGRAETGPKSLVNSSKTGQDSLVGVPASVPDTRTVLSQFLEECGQGDRPEQELHTRDPDHNQSIPISGTPFRLSSDGRLLVAVDLQGLLQDQGLPRKTAERLAAQTDPEAVAKVLLNAFTSRVRESCRMARGIFAPVSRRGMTCCRRWRRNSNRGGASYSSNCARPCADRADPGPGQAV